jgi:hypothetical protein
MTLKAVTIILIFAVLIQTIGMVAANFGAIPLHSEASARVFNLVAFLPEQIAFLLFLGVLSTKFKS